MRLRQGDGGGLREEAVRLSRGQLRWIVHGEGSRAVSECRDLAVVLDDVTGVASRQRLQRRQLNRGSVVVSGRRALRTIRWCPGRWGCCRLQRREWRLMPVVGEAQEPSLGMSASSSCPWHHRTSTPNRRGDGDADLFSRPCSSVMGAGLRRRWRLGLVCVAAVWEPAASGRVWLLR